MSTIVETRVPDEQLSHGANHAFHTLGVTAHAVSHVPPGDGTVIAHGGEHVQDNRQAYLLRGSG